MIATVMDCLQDDYSRKTLQAYIDFTSTKNTCSVLELIKDSDEQYFDDDIIRLGENETFVDMGVLDGGSSIAFAEKVNFKYNKILMFEPDSKSYINSKMNILKAGLKNVHIFNEACYSHNTELFFTHGDTGNSRIVDISAGRTVIKAVALDDKLQSFPEIDDITYIKMDIEGSEYEALKGSINTIKKYKPKLAVSLYHKKEDIYKLPIFIKEILPEYKLYIRHYKTPPGEEYSLEESLKWELVCYAII